MFKIEKFNVSFKEQTLYQDAQLNLQGPGLYALVAKNGTGKSIFFKSLMGCIKSSFSLSIDGHNHKESLELISYVAAENNLFNSLTLMENLQLFSSDLDIIEQYLERFKLQDRKRIKCKKLSAGERQRAAIILGILEGNPVLLLDEPI
ncbi:MAG TPA: ATP-binding cassette domain-containing protein, partial [Candidatus Pelethenecus sp.]|nr:ATP-binding cassette domain-containing protein [Candidatus Pelethenecus sp.]